ncbi:hypothetical protein ACFSS9_14220 [Paenibacillus septentrionalis]|uniref:hypothetical protein n=1 Tax=Paenibacillus septentrionalis TaxID=429342 RepID=UPI00362F43A0
MTMEVTNLVRSQCPFCSVQCKMQIEFSQMQGAAEAEVKVEGLMNKASEGRLCVKGMNAYQHATSNERLTHPLIKKERHIRSGFMGGGAYCRCCAANCCAG